jgi:hypothetical protein
MLPGFSAEATLYTTLGSYQSPARGGAGPIGVAPATFHPCDLTCANKCKKLECTNLTGRDLVRCNKMCLLSCHCPA